MNPTLNIAIAQINVELLQLKQNLTAHADWITSARDQGAQLLLFRNCR